ncbi:IclR family transcriptional regulator [Streptomyces sp. NPDC002513]
MRVGEQAEPWEASTVVEQPTEKPAKSEPARLDQRAAQRDGDIQAVTRCAEILRMVARDQEIRPTDVAKRLGLQRSTAHRYLASMAGAGLIERHDGGTFGPGPLAVHLGASAMRESRVLDIAAPYMADLSAQAHETVVLSLWSGAGAVVARVQEDAGKLVQVVVREGSELPPFAAQSQLFLAHHPDQDHITQLIASLPPHVRNEVEQSVERARRTGLGEHSMVVQGVRAIAAPVFDGRGVIRATVALVGTSDAIAVEPDSRLAMALRDTASRISARLGHTEVVQERAE